MTVFITKSPVPDNKGWMPDLSSAQNYGPAKFVFEGHEHVYALPGPSLHKARRVLKDFDWTTDYLLHPNSFDQMALVCAMTAILELAPDYVNILYFDRAMKEDGTRDRRSGSYYPIRLELKRSAHAAANIA